MPSFVVHSICGNLLINKLNLDEENENKFLISNLLPDSLNTKYDEKISELENRHKIQLEKITTHFRKNITENLECPSLDLYLNKYEKSCKENIEDLAYFFHLYTDFYYFKYFLPTTIKFFNEEHKESVEKEETVYVEINKTGNIINKQDFWNNENNDGIYQEYSRLNKYLVYKYSLNINTKELLNYLKNNKINISVKETNSNNANQVINKLDRLLQETKECTDYQLKIFNEDEVDNLINNIVETFIEKYNYLLKNYIR